MLYTINGAKYVEKILMNWIIKMDDGVILQTAV